MMHESTNRESTREPGSIHVVRADYERLRALVDGTPADAEARRSRERLSEELERAVVVEADEVPTDVVTLDSWVRLLDLDSERELLVSPVLPSKANADAGRLSVLAPLGMAVLGYQKGDTIEWTVPGGLRRLHVLEVMYQPEAHARRRETEAAAPRGIRRGALRRSAAASAAGLDARRS